MKKIFLLGSVNQLGERLSNMIQTNGYSIKQIQELESLQGIADVNSLVLCAGTIKVDSEGNYYIEL